MKCCLLIPILLWTDSSLPPGGTVNGPAYMAQISKKVFERYLKGTVLYL